MSRVAGHEGMGRPGRSVILVMSLHTPWALHLENQDNVRVNEDTEWESTSQEIIDMCD